MFIEEDCKASKTVQESIDLRATENKQKLLPPPWQNFNYQDLENEVWKEIPGFDDYFLISNFGRAKSVDRIIYTSNNKQRFFKGIILKQTVIKTFNKTVGDYSIDCKVGFSHLGKSHTVRMATMVYSLFGKNIRNKLIVSHIDGNNLNNAINNLKLITLQQKQKRVYDNSRCVKIFKFQTAITQKKAVVARHKPVTQFCLQGNPIKSYSSIQEASLQTRIDPSSIVAAIKQKKMVSAGGLLWQYGVIDYKIDTSFYKNFMKKSKQNKSKPVIQISTSLQAVNQFKSISEAAIKLNIHPNKITQALKNSNILAGGFYWKEFIN